MTTKAAENLYLAQHLYNVEGKNYAIFNPNYKPLNELPVIYGFNNGGGTANLIAEDGVFLGGHTCSHEGYMPHDLGILDGSRLDRHEEFKKHYPDGYRMDFVSYDEAEDHGGLKSAFKKYEQLNTKEDE